MLRIILVALLAVAAVVNSESFDEKLSSSEDNDSNLGPAPNPDELTEEFASKEHLDFPDEDDTVEGELNDELQAPWGMTEDNIQEGEMTEEQDFNEENDLDEDAGEYPQGEDSSKRWVSRCPPVRPGFICCNGRPYNSSLYKCCSGKWVRRKCFPCPRILKCGSVSYNAYFQGCCRVCSKPTVYSRLTQKCCYGSLIDVRLQCLPRCGSITYIPPLQRCCRYRIGSLWRYRVYYPYSGQRCCPRSVRGVVYNCSKCPH